MMSPYNLIKKNTSCDGTPLYTRGREVFGKKEPHNRKKCNLD